MKFLFNNGNFTLHSGKQSGFKIDCDALSGPDYHALAKLVAPELQPFGEVIGIPRGGVAFAAALRAYSTEGPRLLVDDVLSTGASFREHRIDRSDKGVVIFVRDANRVPSWVLPIFILHHSLRDQ